MPTRAWRDRVKFVTATTGTGTITVPGAAATGYQLFAATDNGLEFTFFIEDGLAWEVSKGIYTHAGTTLARVLISSSTGSLLVLSGSATVGVDWVTQDANSYGFCVQAYITGCLITKGTGNTINISAGSCFDPSSNRIINYAGGTNLAAGTLGTSQWNQVYIYDNAGVTAIQVVNSADPPSTTYAGPARQGGTNSNRRWIGSFLTTAASAITPQDVREPAAGTFEVGWITNPQTAPFRVLSAGSSTTYAAVSLVGCVPRYVASSFGCLGHVTLVTTAGDNCLLYFSLDGTNLNYLLSSYIYLVNAFGIGTGYSALEPSTPQIQYKVAVGGGGSGPRAYIDVFGYRASR